MTNAKTIRYRPETNQEASWSLSRMGKLIHVWEKLTVIDRQYILRRIRDKEPALFYGIASERGEGNGKG